MKRLLAVIVWLLPYSSTFGMEAWESNYTRLLQKYVKTSGVQYSAWKENSPDVAFLNNSSEAIKPAGNGYAVSRIFDWYKDGFVASGGTVGFINKYRNETVPPDAKISFQDYNWNLNEAK
jgi:hypothetical protein